MTDKNIEARLENLKRPEFSSEAHKQYLKLTLMNARSSSRIGIVLILIPCLFILAIILKYGFGLDIPGFSTVEDMFARWDKTPSMKFFTPVVLALAPTVALIINLLAITHFQKEKGENKLVITIRLKLLNILIILASMAILGGLLLHIVSEGSRHH